MLSQCSTEILVSSLTSKILYRVTKGASLLPNLFARTFTAPIILTYFYHMAKWSKIKRRIWLVPWVVRPATFHCINHPIDSEELIKEIGKQDLGENDKLQTKRARTLFPTVGQGVGGGKAWSWHYGSIPAWTGCKEDRGGRHCRSIVSSKPQAVEHIKGSRLNIE